MTYVVGITGGIGSGKSIVCNQLAALGVTIVDADIAARDVVAVGSKVLSKIERQFGADMLLPSGDLDRSKLRQLIFSDEKAKQWLESLLHPLIRCRVIEQLDQCDDDFCVLVSPLLLESQQRQLIDYLVVIDASATQQLQRTSERDNVTTENVKAIMDAQMERDERTSMADYVVNNQGTLSDLRDEVGVLYRTLCEQVHIYHDKP